MDATRWPMALEPTTMLGAATYLNDPAPLAGGRWVEAAEPHDGLLCRFQPGTLLDATHLACDLLLDGNTLGVFAIFLQEGDAGPEFRCQFGLLNQCQARIRLPLAAVDQNRWNLGRQGAWLKALCGGDRVDLSRVDRLRFVCYRKAEAPLRWCMTPILAVDREPEPLAEPLLPLGPLLDELGQSTLHDWPGRTGDETELVERLTCQRDEAERQQWPGTFSRFGGWTERQFDATGYFRTHHDGRRWWLVDPDGFAFWSAGLDCVRPNIESNVERLETALTWAPPRDGPFANVLRTGPSGSQSLNYLGANFIRAFGPDRCDNAWATIALSLLRRFGFNTVANWSQWQIAAAAGFPYVRPLSWPLTGGPQAPRIFRDFPDVFDAGFEQEAAHYATQLEATRDDPALVGYFLMNEPTWGFAELTPAEGMLFSSTGGPTREAFAAFLRDRHGDDRGLSSAWGEDVSLSEIERGQWQRPVPPGAKADLEAFSTAMVKRLFATLTRACRHVDGHHLNLGARYYAVPPAWAMAGMTCFDVFSVNGYRERVDRQLADACRAMDCPAMIGEWHFGALDVGLPATGIGRVATQADRGRAYRVYLEDAAAQPWCVGVHYFTLYDQSALGRFDGENYQIGFVDVCHRPYEPLAQAARASHERLYDIADGRVAPFDDAPEHLPRLFC